jgi:hypothetical protein
MHIFSWTHLVIYRMGIIVESFRVQSELLPAPAAEVKILNLCIFMAQIFIKHRHNFTFMSALKLIL